MKTMLIFLNFIRGFAAENSGRLPSPLKILPKVIFLPKKFVLGSNHYVSLKQKFGTPLKTA